MRIHDLNIHDSFSKQRTNGTRPSPFEDEPNEQDWENDDLGDDTDHDTEFDDQIDITEDED